MTLVSLGFLLIEKQIIFILSIYFSDLDCFPDFKLLNCVAYQALWFTLVFTSPL